MGEDLKIPKTWEFTRLGEVCSIVTDGTHKTPIYVDNGIPFISIANIRPFEPINFNKYLKYITKQDHLELCKRAKPEKDDILFPRIGTLGYAKRIDFDFEVSIFVGLGLAKPLKKFVDPKYLEFYMNSHWVNKFSIENATGTGRLTLPLEASRILPIPLPPLLEQHRIVAKIEELFSSLDKGIESLKTAQQQLKVYRQAVLKWAFEGKLTNKDVVDGELPKGWEYTTVSELVQTLDQGWSPKCENRASYGDSEWAVIKTTAIQSGYFVGTENKALPLDLKPREQHELQAGDVLVTRAGPRIRAGVCCMVRNVRPKLMNCDKVYRIRVKAEKVTPAFLSMMLNSPKYLEKIEEMKTGISDSGVNITQKGFLRIEIQLPSIVEQQYIVAEIESRLSVCDKIEESIEQSLKKAESLRQSILRKAFEGKLVPQDSNDEPAGVLLDRIKAERKNKLRSSPSRGEGGVRVKSHG